MQFVTNAFSPFARKVALALEYKGLEHAAIDGLDKANHELLWKLNPRGEVPILVDGELVLANSAQILAYLEDAYPSPAILPGDARHRAHARTLERLFDTRVDAILVDCSLWTWAKRDDAPPPGLFAAGQRDLDVALAEAESLVSGGEGFAFGATPGLADFALWPHLAAIEPLGFSLNPDRFPRLRALLAHMKSDPLFRRDASRTRQFLKGVTANSHEQTRIAWRGDRIEWLLARGYHGWFMAEIAAGRVIWPVAQGPSPGSGSAG